MNQSNQPNSRIGTGDWLVCPPAKQKLPLAQLILGVFMWITTMGVCFYGIHMAQYAFGITKLPVESDTYTGTDTNTLTER